MTDDGHEGRDGRDAAGEDGVLGNLPATRPSRLGRQARAGAAGDDPGPAPAKRKPAAKAPGTAKRGGTPKAGATGRPGRSGTAATGDPARGTDAAGPAAPVVGIEEAPERHRARRAPRGTGPKAVRPGAPELEKDPAPAGHGDERLRPPSADAPQPPSGTELITTAIRATGELAQIGVTLGLLVARRILRRLPLP